MKIDGRQFEGTTQQITASQNDYIIGHLRAAGALEVLSTLDKNTHPEKLTAAREELVTRIFLSGRKSQVLAGVLTEIGKQWSRAEAERNAARFDALTDPEEQQTMTAAVVRTVIDFFGSAGKSSESSPKSSNPSDEVVPSPNADPANSVSSVH
jgi:hypothetical protein